MGFTVNGFAVNGCNGAYEPESAGEGQRGLFDRQKNKRITEIAIGAVSGLVIGAIIGVTLSRKRKK